MKIKLKTPINPLRFFLNDSRSTGVLLLLCTAFSLIFSNNLSGESYRQIWNGSLPVFSDLNLPSSFGHWINDFFMAFFFLLAGMEIKRELTAGELSSFKRAVLPFGAAFGGMLVPALIYLMFNYQNGQHLNGWGIPTATDIAFSLGALSLFGKRVPVGLKILLMALAIIDDLGAIIVIALFYGGKIQLGFLLISGIVYLLLWACNIFKIKFGIIQVTLSLLLWYCMLNSGIEASITGVLVAFATPIRMLPRIEKIIHRPVNFIIIPLFALANTAIAIRGDIFQSMSSSVAIGVIAGLVVGKPIGIYLVSRLLVGLKIAHLPTNVNWRMILCMGTLAGIGFTMSIFTTALAFKDEGLKDIAKMAILVSVLTSVIVSWINFVTAEKKKVTIPAIANPASPATALR